MVPNCVPAGMKKGGLKKWFSEKWVDIGSPKKGGGSEENKSKNLRVNFLKNAQKSTFDDMNGPRRTVGQQI